MATRRFCDKCDNLLTPEDDKPFIRFDPHNPIKVVLLVTDPSGGVLNDVCVTCKTGIVVGGSSEPPDYSHTSSSSASEFAMPRMGSRSPGGSGGGSGAQAADKVEPAPYVPSLKPSPEGASSQPQKPEGEPG